MSRSCRVGMTAGVFAVLAAAAALFVVGAGSVEGAKAAAAGPIYFSATLEPLWFNANGEGIATKIASDAQGPYVNMTDKRTVKYGVTVKYTPPSRGVTRGEFVMKVDRAGILGRYATMKFENPVSGTNCLPKPKDEAACEQVRGFMDADPNVETRYFGIKTQIVLDEVGGSLVRNVTDPLEMDRMVSGQRKVVGLGIDLIPDVEGYDYTYNLGNFTDPANYVPGSPCQDQNYVWGPAELVCLSTGQIWEFRPLTEVYYNEPDGRLRQLWGLINNPYGTFCRYNKWDMPFVLRVVKQ